MKTRTTYDAAYFRKALALVLPAVSARSTLPILSMVRVRSDFIQGSNGDLQIKVPLGSDGEQLDICIPADRLKAAAEVATGSLYISLEGPKCIIQAGRHKFSVPCLPGEQFPEMALKDAEGEFQSTTAIHMAIERVAVFAAVNDIRYYLRGVCIESTAKDAFATATNGWYAGNMALPVGLGSFAMIVPVAVAMSMGKVAPGRWQFTSQLVQIDNEDMQMIFKRVEGAFPDWRRIFPADAATIAVNRAELDQVVHLSRLTVANKIQGMRLTSAEGMLRLNLPGTDTTIDSEAVVTGGSGEQINTAVNGKLLATIIKAIPDENLVIGFQPGNPKSALKIVSSDGLTTILMPMRL